MRERIRRITKLVHVKAAGNFFGEAKCYILVILGMAARHIRPCDPHFGAERSHMRYLFLRHLVGNHEQDAIAFRTRDKREAKTSIACGGFNDRATGF